MIRREALWAVLGGMCLAACAPLSATTRSAGPPPAGEPRAGAGAKAGARAGTEAYTDEAAITLEVKPIEPAGALARTTGHCDLDGVLAAHGSPDQARRACDRDVEVEQDLAHGLRISRAYHRHNEGRMRHLAGDPAQARLDYQEAIRQDTHGRPASAVSTLARINLGLLDHEQGDQATARTHLHWVLDHSDEAAVRGAAYHNLALVELEQGDTEAALQAAQRGHRLLRQALGRSHGSVGAALNALGVIHAERGELDEAVESLEAAVEVRRAALGELHPATAASYTNLGVTLGRRGDWDEALLAHQEALAIDEAVLGPRHAITAADHGHVGSALLALDWPADARRSFRAALAILEPERPADDPEVDRLHQWLRECDEAVAQTGAPAQGSKQAPSSSYPPGAVPGSK